MSDLRTPPAGEEAERDQAAGRGSTSTCGACRFFIDEPAAFEQQLPGILALSSGEGDSRGTQGLCELHAQMLDAHMTCPRFAPR